MRTRLHEAAGALMLCAAMLLSPGVSRQCIAAEPPARTATTNPGSASRPAGSQSVTLRPGEKAEIRPVSPDEPLITGATPKVTTGPPTTMLASTQATMPASRPASSPAASRPTSLPATADACRERLMKGDYDDAAAGCRKLASQDSLRLAASIGLSEALQAQGKYAEAIDALKAAEKQGAADAGWQAAMAAALSSVGRYEEALACATKANELRPVWAEGIFARGNLLETLGRNDQAVEVYKTMDQVVASDAYRKSAPELVAIGRILDRFAILTGKRASEQASNILNNYLQVAYQQVDKKYWPANVAAGAFLLSKHRPQQAAEEFDLALKLNPRQPDAMVGLGLADLEDWKFEDAIKHAEEALKINPSHADALVLKATTLMQWRKFEQVEPVLQQALKSNPNCLDALSLLAALHTRLGHEDKARPFIEAVEKVNPRYADLPNAIGQWLVAARQFPEAEKYLRRAAEMAPQLADPLTNLGLMYMQTGDEAKAKATLEQAHQLDDFRADVVNYLGLLELLEKFQVKETEHFIVKVDGTTDAVLLDQVAELAEKIGAEVRGDFNHNPPAKTIIEIFPGHKEFSIRITGKGWIGTVGASTGRVIAMSAPNAERSQMGMFNWATVLRHEYTHTVTLSATNDRIPHWFTEACAVWEQPDRRNYEAMQQLVGAVRGGRLFHAKEIDWGFIRPQRGSDRSLAYAQAEWMMEYIIATKGFAAIGRMLDGFRDGATQAEVFQKALETGEEQFDKDFGEWAKGQVKDWGFDPARPPDVPQAAKEAKDKPTDAAAQGRLARAYLLAGNTAQAQSAALVALDMDANCKEALAAMSLALTAEKKYDTAVDAAERLENVDHTSRVAPRVLAECHLARHDWAQAVAALELLKQRVPMDPYGYEQLALLYEQLGQPDKALPNYVELHNRTMRDPKYARRAAEICRSMGKDDEAMRFYAEVTHINPYEVSAYQAMASIHLKARRYEQAISAMHDVCLLQPESAESWNAMALVQYRSGKATGDKAMLRQARESAEKAVKFDAASPARELIEKIDEAVKP